jgi:hypothetical protein
MTDWTQAQDGGCRCGALRFRLTGAPFLTSVCHCTGCQKMTGSAFSLTVTAPAQAFEVLLGEPVIGGLHGPVAHHFHCDECKSWVFTRAGGMDWFVNIRATMLDQPDDAPPFLETWTSEKLPWAETGAVKSYPGNPDWNDWEALTAEYAAGKS